MGNKKGLSQAEMQTPLHRKDLDHTADAGGPLRSLPGKVQEVGAHYLEVRKWQAEFLLNASRSCFE